MDFLKQPHEPICLSDFDRSQHLIEKPFDSIIKAVLARFAVVLDKLQRNQPLQRGSIDEFGRDLRRDAGASIFKKPL